MFIIVVSYLRHWFGQILQVFTRIRKIKDERLIS